MKTHLNESMPMTISQKANNSNSEHSILIIIIGGSRMENSLQHYRTNRELVGRKMLCIGNNRRSE